MSSQSQRLRALRDRPLVCSNKLRSALAVILAAATWGGSMANAAPAAPQGTLFQNSDRWTAVGDSITHGGTYYAWVYLYYATRFPDRKLDFFNAGNSGDDAHGTLKRYDWDIQPHKSTVASIMLGMNDVRREIYGDMPLTNQLRDQRTYALENYRKNMTEMVKRIQADGARVILITPSIYDETAQNPQSAVLTGVNGALGECATFMRNLAVQTGCAVIDFHDSMGALNAKIQDQDPAASLIKPDRIHPNPLGHFVLAYLFLKGQQAPAVVSSVSLDATGARVLESDNATVANLTVRNHEVTFTLSEKALPYPVDKEQEPALAWVPFNDEFNREMLKVSGLAPGEYQLSIDGEAVRRFNHETLATGVNLALENNTPQARQAAGVLELVKTWYKQVQEVRVTANFEFWRLGDVPHPIALESVRARVETDMARLAEQFKDAPKERYKADYYARYLKTKPCEAANIAMLGEIADKIRTAARPQPHAFKLEFVQSQQHENRAIEGRKSAGANGHPFAGAMPEMPVNDALKLEAPADHNGKTVEAQTHRILTASVATTATANLTTIGQAPTPRKLMVMQDWDDSSTNDLPLIVLLKKYKAKATFNIIPLKERGHGVMKKLNQDKGTAFSFMPKGTQDGFNLEYLRTDEMKAIYKGFKVAAHCDFSKDETPEAVEPRRRVLMETMALIKENFGQEKVGFVYPGGRYNQTVMQAVQDAGYLYARTTKSVDAPLPLDIPMALPTSCKYDSKQFWERYEAAKKSGGVFYFWGHSSELGDDKDLWDKLEHIYARISADPEAEWIDPIDLFSQAGK